MHGRQKRDRVVQILGSHGADFINANGPRTIEIVAAGRGSDMRVLIVEDDPLLGDALAAGLKQRGFEADWVQDGRDAQAAIRVEPFAAVVLDLGLPGLGGLDLLRSERGRGNKVPVLILTARDAVQSRITGLDSGADDYVVKPTDLDELAARLRALVRRSKGEPAPVLRVAQLVLDPAARMVTRDGQVMDLQPREFTLLQELMLNAGRVLSREQLEERMYRWGEEVESNAVEVHVHHLRRKLGVNIVKTIRGVGYVMPRGEHAC